MTRRFRALSAVLPAAVCLLSAGVGQAQAAGYRYWSFWDRDGGHWTYATEGPSTARPADGDVQGFRFAVSQDSQDAAQPRGSADFAAICAKTPAQQGKKRIALVLDFGTKADAPSGETPPAPRTACARVPADATTAEALAAVAGPLRYDTNALLCAIAGYPRKGCGEQVTSGKSTPSKSDGEAKKTDEGGGPSVGLVAGGAVVLALAGAAVWQSRRRRGDA
ncbi:SCO2322 family protein [Streptomyces sp. MK5]|uniref:SCO2322 family protein n=1 Tax=Streptomyces sp. MK5 TaxID=3064253 RepID=UPI0027422F95|nr:SCO2322 family protein [Streptomyces sp. MK5]